MILRILAILFDLGREFLAAHAICVDMVVTHDWILSPHKGLLVLCKAVWG